MVASTTVDCGMESRDGRTSYHFQLDDTAISRRRYRLDGIRAKISCTPGLYPVAYTIGERTILSSGGESNWSSAVSIESVTISELVRQPGGITAPGAPEAPSRCSFHWRFSTRTPKCLIWRVLLVAIGNMERGAGIRHMRRMQIGRSATVLQ